MIKEDAIEVLKEISTTLKSWSGFTSYPQAIDMAIEALSADGDLISRTDAIKMVEAKIRWFNGNAIEDRCKRDAFIQVIDMLSELPSADRPSGEWIFKPKNAIELMFTKPKCSICGFESADGLNYCPSCGARMENKE